MKIRAYAPENHDPTIGLFFEHERICTLCHNPNDGVLNPHPDCQVGKEAYLRSKQRLREILNTFYEQHE
jgi:hypothetical protein